MAKKEAKKDRRLPKDFDVRNPGIEITDPDAADAASEGVPMNREYPKHLAKAEGDNRIVVSVEDASDERRMRAQGYMTHHELDVVQVAAKAKGAKVAKPAAAKAKKKAAPKKKAAAAHKAPVL